MSIGSESGSSLRSTPSPQPRETKQLTPAASPTTTTAATSKSSTFKWMDSSIFLSRKNSTPSVASSPITNANTKPPSSLSSPVSAALPAATVPLKTSNTIPIIPSKKIKKKSKSQNETLISSTYCHGLISTLKYCLQICLKNNVFAHNTFQPPSITTDTQSNNNNNNNATSSDQNVTTNELSAINTAATATNNFDTIKPLFDWKVILSCILNQAITALNTAMIVVAEAHTDEPFGIESSAAATTTTSTTAPSYVSKGPMNSMTSSQLDITAASYINTNSLFGSAFIDTKHDTTDVMVENDVDTNINNHDGNDNDDNKNVSAGRNDTQRAVVAAWLLVKESCGLLACLVQIACDTRTTSHTTIEKSSTSNNTNTSTSTTANTPATNSKQRVNKKYLPLAHTSMSLLSSEQIGLVGRTVLDALGRLKHMGAIAEAQISLQNICEILLRYILYLYIISYTYYISLYTVLLLLDMLKILKKRMIIS